MGTTLTAPLLAGDDLVLAQVGDSRCYLLRDGELTQLTRDDTFVQALVDQGALAPDAGPAPSAALPGHPGGAGRPTPRRRSGCSPWSPATGCCCAATGSPTTSRTRRSPRRWACYGDRQQCGEQLVKLAHHAGAPDNVTVVVSDVTAPLTATRGMGLRGSAVPAGMVG